MNGEAENRENLERIMRLIRRAVRSKQFALVFANCNALTDQNRYMAELTQRCLDAEITLTNIDLWNRRPIRNLRQVIADHLSQNPPPAPSQEGRTHPLPARLAIQVTGLELSILLDADERSPAVLQTMNLGREGYRAKFPYPLLIWLPDYAYAKLATVAPDFWSVRSGSYTFLSDEKSYPSDELDEVIAEGKNLTMWRDKMGQIPLIERILAWRETLPPETVTDLKLKLGDAYYFIGRLEKARGYYEEALTSIDDEDLDRKGTALNGLGLVLMELGNFSKAIDFLTQYLELRKGQGKLDAQAVGYNHLGLAYHKQGDDEPAIVYYQQALHKNRQLGNRKAESEVLGNLGLAYRKAKRFDEAIESHDMALRISRELNDPQSATKDLGNIGLVYDAAGDYKRAIEYYSQALQLSQQTGNRRDRLDGWMNLGMAWQDLGDFEKARDCYREAHQIAQEIGTDELAVMERLAEVYGPTGLRDVNGERYWAKALVKRSEEMADWESQLRAIERLTELCRREGEGHEERDCLLTTEGLLHRLLKQPETAGNAIVYYEKLIDIYSQLHLDEQVKAYRQKLEDLKKSRQLHIWLPPGAVEVEDERPVLQAGQPHIFYIQIGPPPAEYAWIYHRDFQSVATGGRLFDGKREGIRVSTETTEKESIDTTPPSLALELSVEPSKEGEAGSASVVLSPESTTDEASGRIPADSGLDAADAFGPARTVSFQFQGDDIRFDATEKALSLREGQSAEVLSLIVIPEKPGDHRISVTVTAADHKFQDEFEILLRANLSPSPGRGVERTETERGENSPFPHREGGRGVRFFPGVSLPPLKGTRGKDGAPMVLIPAGEFLMGSPGGEGWNNEHPQHTVYLDAFYMDVYPVTNAQYRQFVKETGHPEPKGYGYVDGKWRDGFEPWKDSKFNGDDHPVVCVSWYDAMAYCQWAGKTLPTEAQWEKAARGGLEGKRYPWGDEIDESKANYDMTAGHTTPVGSYPPNGYGLYDMAGNVWEWCLDAYDPDFYAKSPKNNPVAGGLITNVNRITTPRVLRGGSWYFIFPDYARVAYRGWGGPMYGYMGFRCASPRFPR